MTDLMTVPGLVASITDNERRTLTIATIGSGAAFVAGLAGCRPVGLRLTDALVIGALAAVMTFLGSRSAPVPLAIGGGVALLFGGTLSLRVVALISLGLAIYLVTAEGPTPDRAVILNRWHAFAMAGAGSAALTTQVLLRLPVESPARMSAGMAALGMVPIAVSGWYHLSERARKAGRLVVVAIVAFALIGVLSGGITALRSVPRLNDGRDSISQGVALVRGGEYKKASSEFGAAADDLEAADKATSGILAWPARHVPLISQQVLALETVSRYGGEAASDAQGSTGELNPDLFAIKGGRIDPGEVKKAQPVLARLADSTSNLSDKLAQPELRSSWQLPAVAEGLEEVSKSVADANGTAETALLTAQVGPKLLGQGGQATYFVAFVSPSEARGSGFMGNYGIMTIKDGVVEMPKVGSNDDLNKAGVPAKTISDKEYLDRYGAYEPASTWENVTMTPDRTTAAKVMAELYSQSGGSQVDGVIMIDPTALAAMIEITGPISIEGVPYQVTADNAKAFLEIEQYRIFDVADERTDMLGQVAQQVFGLLLDGEQINGTGLASKLGPSVQDEHLSVWLRDPEGQKLIDRLDATGAVPALTGDGFGVITQNAGGGKIDAFLQRNIDYKAQVEAKSGLVSAVATVKLRNGAPAKDEPEYLIGNLIDDPAGTNTSLVALYTPLEAVRVVVNGKDVQFGSTREFGRNVYLLTVKIKPGESMEIALQLEGRVDVEDGDYTFDWLGQNMVNPDQVKVEVGVAGAKVSSAPMKRPPTGDMKLEKKSFRATSGDSSGSWQAAITLK